jgi:hypothetical protein
MSDLPATPPETGQSSAPALRVDVSGLNSSYCNMCNVNSNREEVVLNFGVNQDWDRARGGEVKLLHRIILSPYAAKRVADLLARVIQDYEGRHGKLS